MPHKGVALRCQRLLCCCVFQWRGPPPSMSSNAKSSPFPPCLNPSPNLIFISTSPPCMCQHPLKSSDPTIFAASFLGYFAIHLVILTILTILFIVANSASLPILVIPIRILVFLEGDTRTTSLAARPPIFCDGIDVVKILFQVRVL